MNLAVHICSFNGRDYHKRFLFLKKILKNYFEISKNVKIFIHTNKITKEYKLKNIKYIVYNLKKKTLLLSWKCRPLIEKQKLKFDYFIYSRMIYCSVKKISNIGLIIKIFALK